MTERLFATGDSKERIHAELCTYRAQDEVYLKEMHPHTSFVTLEALANDPAYANLVSQPLLGEAFFYLAQRLDSYKGCQIFDPERVWVGIYAPVDANFFGGFYHANQGYRYLQQIAMVSLSGLLSAYPVDRTLVTLELIRAYAHDTLHHNTHRLFLSLPDQRNGEATFYRFQYGINFRRWNGKSYSAKDPISASTTRNLGNIMEAATDRFAHEFVLFLVDKVCYTPPASSAEEYIYRDCTGKLTLEDIIYLRNIEKGYTFVEANPAFKIYLRNMRLFVQYVTMRYRHFLKEFDPEEKHALHSLILECMLSGKLKKLCQCLDEIYGTKHSFVTLFKTSAYTKPI